MGIADQYIQTGKIRRALVIGVELLTRIIDWEDRNTCVLFGDAAGAMVLAPSADKQRGILSTHLHSDGRLAEILWIRGGGSKHPPDEEMLKQKLHKVSMNGREVYKIAVRALYDSVVEALEANGITASQVNHVIAHQANIRIIESVMQRLGIPLEKCWLNISKYGNTSSASLPMTLDEANRAGRLKPGDLIVMMAIGAGIAWGSAVVRW
jgi:3-oxoacyl-[acyl-carrier-protein] synthase-3